MKVALISACAALLGALTGGASTFLVAARSEESKQREDRRVERREAYSKYYGDASSLAGQITIQARNIVKASYAEPRDSSRLSKILSDLEEKKRQLHQDQALVVLLGSKEVADKGFKLANAIERMRDEAAREDPNLQDMLATVDGTAKALDEFSHAARADLDLE